VHTTDWSFHRISFRFCPDAGAPGGPDTHPLSVLSTQAAQRLSFRSSTVERSTPRERSRRYCQHFPHTGIPRDVRACDRCCDSHGNCERGSARSAVPWRGSTTAQSYARLSNFDRSVLTSMDVRFPEVLLTAAMPMHGPWRCAMGQSQGGRQRRTEEIVGQGSASWMRCLGSDLAGVLSASSTCPYIP